MVTSSPKNWPAMARDERHCPEPGLSTNARIAADLIPGEYWAQVRHYNQASGMGDYSIKVRRL